MFSNTPWGLSGLLSELYGDEVGDETYVATYRLQASRHTMGVIRSLLWKSRKIKLLIGTIPDGEEVYHRRVEYIQEKLNCRRYLEARVLSGSHIKMILTPSLDRGVMMTGNLTVPDDESEGVWHNVYMAMETWQVRAAEEEIMKRWCSGIDVREEGRCLLAPSREDTDG